MWFCCVTGESVLDLAEISSDSATLEDFRFGSLVHIEILEAAGGFRQVSGESLRTVTVCVFSAASFGVVGRVATANWAMSHCLTEQ